MCFNLAGDQEGDHRQPNKPHHTRPQGLFTSLWVISGQVVLHMQYVNIAILVWLCKCWCRLLRSLRFGFAVYLLHLYFSGLSGNPTKIAIPVHDAHENFYFYQNFSITLSANANPYCRIFCKVLVTLDWSKNMTGCTVPPLYYSCCCFVCTLDQFTFTLEQSSYGKAFSRLHHIILLKQLNRQSLRNLYVFHNRKGGRKRLLHFVHKSSTRCYHLFRIMSAKNSVPVDAKFVY